MFIVKPTFLTTWFQVSGHRCLVAKNTDCSQSLNSRIIRGRGLIEGIRVDPAGLCLIPE